MRICGGFGFNPGSPVFLWGCFYVKIMMAYGYKSSIRETESNFKKYFSEIMYMIKTRIAVSF